MNLTPEQIQTLEYATESSEELYSVVGAVRGIYPDLPYEQQKEMARQAIRGCSPKG